MSEALYSMAVQSVFEAASGAAGRAAYGQAYQNEAQRLAGKNRKVGAERNIAAVKQDKILTNRQIELNQTQSEAMIKLAAAVSGVTGGSVQDVQYMTEVNKVNAQRASSRESDQVVEAMTAEVQAAHAGTLGIQDDKVSGLGNVLGKLGQLGAKDWKDAGKAVGLFGG